MQAEPHLLTDSAVAEGRSALLQKTTDLAHLVTVDDRAIAEVSVDDRNVLGIKKFRDAQDTESHHCNIKPLSCTSTP
jgi:hypothetical protein